MRILCFDVGSSSVKFGLYAADAAAVSALQKGSRDATGEAGAAAAIAAVRAELGGESVDAIGHRVVFAGPDAPPAIAATPETIRALGAFEPRFPLHLPAQRAFIAAAAAAFAGVPAALCSDTAFHRGLPPVARRYPFPDLPDGAIERIGFHGLSFDYIFHRDPSLRCGRTIVAHLGSGASLCGVRDGRVLETTMGCSVLGGVVMATRPGDLDPGAILELLRRGRSVDDVRAMCYEECGWKGLSGGTSDMRTLLAREAADARARDAVESFVYSCVKAAGATIAVLGGLDTLVFTGGIGEGSAEIRERIADGLAFAAPSRVLVVPTDENAAIARRTRELFASDG
jgi:acetate kinase